MEGKQKPKATKEQLAYAQLLDIGMKLGMAIIVVTFIIYAFGILEPNIAFDDLPNQWEKSAEEYVEDNGEITGWAWVNHLDQGDFFNFIGIAFLASVSIFCYIRILPMLLGKKDYIYAALAFTEVVVLVLAASGILKVGGH
jgi:hypothetical protein